MLENQEDFLHDTKSRDFDHDVVLRQSCLLIKSALLLSREHKEIIFLIISNKYVRDLHLGNKNPEGSSQARQKDLLSRLPLGKKR